MKPIKLIDSHRDYVKQDKVFVTVPAKIALRILLERMSLIVPAKNFLN